MLNDKICIRRLFKAIALASKLDFCGQTRSDRSIANHCLQVCLSSLLFPTARSPDAYHMRDKELPRTEILDEGYGRGLSWQSTRLSLSRRAQPQKDHNSFPLFIGCRASLRSGRKKLLSTGQVLRCRARRAETMELCCPQWVLLNTGVLEMLGQDTGISVKADERSPSH